MFTVTTKMRYGLRALVQIAINEGSKPVSLPVIAEEQKISQKYLENIFMLLKRSGIVVSTRGPEGGYKLAKDPAELPLLDVARALEGEVEVCKCLHDDICNNATDCYTRLVWDELRGVISHYFANKTLANVMNKENNSKDETWKEEGAFI